MKYEGRKQKSKVFFRLQPSAFCLPRYLRAGLASLYFINVALAQARFQSDNKGA
jgi:hypothetical protein